jgi:hypothetical protein
MFTNFQIDFAYVVSALVPMILVLIFTEHHLRAVWRIALGLGVIPPLSLFYLRLKLEEPEEYNRERMHKFPIWLIMKFYWKRLVRFSSGPIIIPAGLTDMQTVVSLIWFIYDFSAYSFNIYSSKWLSIILGDNAPLWKSFGWTTVTNAFYIPGSFLGALASDWIGPRNTLALGVGLQGIVGFIMSGCYEYLATPKNVAAFVVVFGYVVPWGQTVWLLTSMPTESFPLWVSSAPVTISASVRPSPVQLPFEVSTTVLLQQWARSALLSVPM